MFLVGQLLFTVFAIVGMQSFQGRLQACYSLQDPLGQELLSYDEPECDVGGGTWRNGDISFDMFGASMLALYELASLEQWPSVM